MSDRTPASKTPLKKQGSFNIVEEEEEDEEELSQKEIELKFKDE